MMLYNKGGHGRDKATLAVRLSRLSDKIFINKYENSLQNVRQHFAYLTLAHFLSTNFKLFTRLNPRGKVLIFLEQTSS